MSIPVWDRYKSVRDRYISIRRFRKPSDEMYLSRTDLYLSQTGMDMSPNYRRAVKYSRRLLPREPNMHCFRLPSR